MASYMPDKELLRMLKEGLNGEKMAARDYELLLKAALNQEDAGWIMRICNDEKRHYLILEDIYRDLTGSGFDINRSPASMPMDYEEMLKTSICDELEAAAFYQKLLNALSCNRHRWQISGILNDEKEHARILAGLFQNLP